MMRLYKTQLCILFSVILCITFSSCRGKTGAKTVELIEKTLKNGADEAVRGGINLINKAGNNDYSIEEEDDDDYTYTEESRGQFIVSEESGDLIYIDEYGDAHQALLDDSGEPYIIE